MRAHSGLSHLEGEGKALETHRADLTFFFFFGTECFASPRLLRHLKVIILKILQLLHGRRFAGNLLFVVLPDMADRLCAARIILITRIGLSVLRFRIR